MDCRRTEKGIIAVCEGCHKEKVIVHIGGYMPFCADCCKGVPKDSICPPEEYLR